MGLPIYAKSLFGLLVLLGMEQREVAKRLGVTDGAISWWATGKRPVSARYEQALLDLVAEAIRAACDATGHGSEQAQAIEGHLRAWQAEMAVTDRRYTEEIQQTAARLTPLATKDIRSFTVAERQAFRGAAAYLGRLISCMDLAGVPRPVGLFGGFSGGPVQGFADLRRRLREDETDEGER